MIPEQLEVLKKYRISIPPNVKSNSYNAEVLFNFLNKNNGLTEEYLYNNENPRSLQLPVYTASYDPIGYLPIDANINKKPLVTCNGEVIIIFRQGYAGLMYIPKEKMFFASEHTIPIQVKAEYKDILNQHWFAKYYQHEIQHYVTGKADSGNFSASAFKKMTFIIPERKWQDKTAKLYMELETEMKKIAKNISNLSISKVQKGLSDSELVDKYEQGSIN